MPRKKTVSDADVLKSAREVFIEKGFAGSTREIARRAGVSEGVLFQRYPTKAELFFAAMVPPPVDFAPFRALLESGDAAGGAGKPQNLRVALERLGLTLLDYFRDALPVLLPLMTHPEFRFEEFAARHPDSSLATLRNEIMQFFIERKIADPSGASLALISSTLGVAMIEKLGAHGGALPDWFVSKMLLTMIDGIVPQSASNS